MESRHRYRQLTAALAFALTAPAQTIQPGDIWPDDRGRHIQAHGGGILKHEGTYYWFGEDRGQDNQPDKRYVSCYASKDLVHWTFRNQVIKQADPGDLGPRFVLERPKVFYNARTKKFVMYMHIDDAKYQLARVGVAVSDTIDGDYQYLRSFRPLGQESRDIGQFIDDDGSAYLIFEDRPAQGFHIARLSDDYLDVKEDVCLIRAPLEGGAVVRYQGLYYAIGSALTGWKPNPNKYATAEKLAGPWSEFRDIAPPETNTYGSQSTMMLKIAGTQTTTVIFMADIWKPRTQWDSRYLWMPLRIGDGKLWLPEPGPWTLNLATGVAVTQPARVYPYRGKYYRIDTHHEPDRIISQPPESWRVNTGRGPRLSAGDVAEGPFTPLPGPFTPAGAVASGGSLYIEGDIPWLVYVHDWTQVIDSFIEAVPLKADLTAAAGTPIYLFKASDALWHREQKDASREPRIYPASNPVVHRAPNGDLLIRWTSPREGKPVLNVARSVTGRIRGPWQQVSGGKP